MAHAKLPGGLVHALPSDLMEALGKAKKAAALWETITPIARNEFICWIEDAKQAATRAKRISRAIEELLDGQKRPCCWVGCIHRTDKKPSRWQQDVLIDKKRKARADRKASDHRAKLSASAQAIANQGDEA